MGPVFYVMAIMGCGDGGAGCNEARIVPTQYRTVQECRANLAGQLARNTDLSFPEITATCRRSQPQIAGARQPQYRG